MRDTLHRVREKAHSSFRQAPRVTGVMIVVLLLLSCSAAVTAQQSGQILIDNLEDGDLSGWSGAELVTDDPIQGDYSVTRDSGAIFTHRAIDAEPYDRISYVVRKDSAGEEAYVTYNRDPDGQSGIQSTDGASSHIPVGEPVVVSSEFDWEDQTVQNSVRYWENGTLIWEGDPTNFDDPAQHVESVELGSGGFSATVDVITANGTEDDLMAPVDRNLTIETRDLVFPDGSTHPYDVILEDTGDVTEDATVTSSNSTLLSVDQTNETVTSINDTNATGVVYLNATYQDGTETRNTTKQVVVASPSVENLELIPTGLWRTYAVASDNTMFALIIAALMSVAAARFAGAFAGLATAEMVIVIGWLGGYVGLGIAMVSVFMCLFIGLNLAANIDYSITRMER